MILEFTATGTPRPQGSKRYVGNGRFVEASDVKPWRKAVAVAVSEAWAAAGGVDPIDSPVVVYASFFLPRPKTVRRRLPAVAPDLDKLQRALGDALSVDAGVLKDDAQIVEWHTSKDYADGREPGVDVIIHAHIN